MQGVLKIYFLFMYFNLLKENFHLDAFSQLKAEQSVELQPGDTVT